MSKCTCKEHLMQSSWPFKHVFPAWSLEKVQQANFFTVGRNINVFRCLWEHFRLTVAVLTSQETHSGPHDDQNLRNRRRSECDKLTDSWIDHSDGSERGPSFRSGIIRELCRRKPGQLSRKDRSRAILAKYTKHQKNSTSTTKFTMRTLIIVKNQGFGFSKITLTSLYYITMFKFSDPRKPPRNRLWSDSGLQSGCHAALMMASSSARFTWRPKDPTNLAHPPHKTRTPQIPHQHQKHEDIHSDSQSLLRGSFSFFQNPQACTVMEGLLPFTLVNSQLHWRRNDPSQREGRATLYSLWVENTLTPNTRWTSRYTFSITTGA